MNKKAIAANIIWSVIRLLINAAITMLVLPYVSEKIGLEAYGFIGLCSNIVAYVDLIASAINIYAVKFISMEYHRNNLSKANQYFNSVLIANLLISTILIIPSTIAVIFLDGILNIPVGLVGDVKLLFILTVMNYIITLIGTVFSTAAFVKNMLYRDSRIRTEGSILKGLIILALFSLLFPRVWYVSVATIFCSLYILICNIRITKQFLPEVKVKPRVFSAKAVIEIASNGLWNSVASLGTMLNSGLDLLVTDFYLGALSMGQLSVPKTLSSFITRLLTEVTNSFRPQLLVYYTKNDIEKLNDGFITSMKSCGLITCTIVSVFVAIGLQFLKLWIPNQDIQLIFNLTVLTFIAETFTGLVKPLHYGCVLTGKLKVPCVANLLVGLFNILGMILFLRITDGGLYVVTITTVVGNITYNFVIMPIYVTKILNMSRASIYRTIISYVIVTIVITIFTFFVFSKIIITNWLSLLVWAALCAIVSSIFYLIVIFDKRSRKKMLNGLYRRINPRSK